ncbi:MAG TPA: hypothetical protein VI685_01190 [Candidatus Angelobacter sp.]
MIGRKTDFCRDAKKASEQSVETFSIQHEQLRQMTRRRDDPISWTRRTFLESVGRAGGASAVYRTMAAIGLLPEPPAWTGPIEPAANSGRDKTVYVGFCALHNERSAAHRGLQ